MPTDGVVGEELKQLKSKIWDLSADEDALLLVEGQYEYEFDFKLEEYAFLATYMLHEDACLRTIRNKLTPDEVSEEEFWRNYFYGIALIRKEAGLSSTLGEPIDSDTKRAKLARELNSN